jgi:hypothetical protein
MVQTRDYSRGAAAFVPNFGTVFSNPIGAGVVAKYRPQASYGMAAQYAAEQLFWTAQAIPTNIPMQGLTDPAELKALLSTVDVTAMMNY